MPLRTTPRLPRREFLGRAARAGALAGWALPMRLAHGAPKSSLLEVGEGTVDTTPPLGIELAGFHRAPGKERRITGIRQPTAARALMLGRGDDRVAVVSVDICGVSRDFARRTQAAVAQAVGMAAENVRICASHTHSMPMLRYLRQWGGIPKQYQAEVQKRIVKAVALAQADLSPAEVYAGRHRVVGGNFNRTTSTWKTDEQFDAQATDAHRWLDTMLHAVVFRRQNGKPDLLRYHFSAHPVCYTDTNAGPDWPGLVRLKTQHENKLDPAFLQGHCGDVNPGSGKPWLGVPEKVADAVHTALRQAIDQSRPVDVQKPHMQTTQIHIPLDIAKFRQQIELYRADPAKCTRGPWVDPPFAADWARGAAKWDLKQTSLAAPLSVLHLGGLALLFHPAELYSFYGLKIRHASPAKYTLVVGYTDALVGYLPDPTAYATGEYAATTVPKILDLPPFTPTAARETADAALALLGQAVG